MSAISNPVALLPGKQPVVLEAQLVLELRFDLWRDYQHWVLPHERELWWLSDSVGDLGSVEVSVCIGPDRVIQHEFDQFGRMTFTHGFADAGDESDLEISIRGLDALPVRDDTGVFTAGMIEIESLRVQDVELVHLLDNTMYGVDCDIQLGMSRPIYAWMVSRAIDILGKRYPPFLLGDRR